MNIIFNNINRIIGVIAAILLSYIYFSGTITGVAGVFFLVLAIVFLIAGFLSPCSFRKSCDSAACKTKE